MLLLLLETACEGGYGPMGLASELTTGRDDIELGEMLVGVSVLTIDTDTADVVDEPSLDDAVV